MRLQQFITEEKDTLLELWIDEISRECRPFLNQMKGSKYTVMRGVKGRHWAFKSSPREDRLPKDTPLKIQNMVDEMFKKKFGWKPRSEGVFTAGSSDRYRMEHYGTVYYFFPARSFRFVWSDEIWDFTLHLEDTGILYSKDRKFYMADDVTDDQIKEVLEDTIPTYKSSNLKKAVETGTEITFKCKNYYMISADVLLKYLSISTGKDDWISKKDGWIYDVILERVK